MTKKAQKQTQRPKHQGRVYLRIRVNPKSIEKGAEVLGRVAETGLNAHGFLSALRMKKEYEKRARLNHTIQTTQSAASIIGSAATAITNAFSR